MSVAAAQYDNFREQVVRDARAFTFTRDGELLVYPVRAGKAVPFWSSRSRLEVIQRRFPKYRQFQITELTLVEFLNRIEELKRAGMQVGVNWSGEHLTGYNVPVPELRAGVQYWIDRLRDGRDHRPPT